MREGKTGTGALDSLAPKMWVRMEAGGELGGRHRLGGLPTPVVVLCAEDHVWYPAFSQHLRNDSWLVAFCILLFPLAIACVRVGFSPLLFLCILLLEKTFVQEPVLQERVPGPSLALVAE